MKLRLPILWLDQAELGKSLSPEFSILGRGFGPPFFLRMPFPRIC